MLDNWCDNTERPFVNDATHAVLAASALFADLPAGVSGRLRAVARTRALTAGEAVYRQGDPPDGLYAVLNGTVRLTSFSWRGDRHLQLLARSGDWFGEVSTLDQGPRQQDAVSEAAATVFHLPMRDIERIAAVEPSLWRAVGRLSSRHQRAALAFFGTVTTMTGEERIARLLQVLNDDRGDAELRVTHEEIATDVGLSRQTVTTILKRLERKGLVTLGYRSIRLGLGFERSKADSA